MQRTWTRLTEGSRSTQDSQVFQDRTTVAPTQSPTRLLLNAAFLQEIKDSNPHLWHQTHDLRVLCQLECGDREQPQATVKRLAICLGELRDQLALQFSLEESYGLIQVADTPAQAGTEGGDEQDQIGEIVQQHGRLYLQVADLVEQAEELQYRGCGANCLEDFASKAEQFSRELTAHERFESDLIRQAQAEAKS